MKPNTPTKMTMISHITYWCSQSMSCAIFEAGDWKYQAIACAEPEAASASNAGERSGELEMSLLPLMFPFPE